jgi:eukaryotic-like serine/threonine-protein kinase
MTGQIISHYEIYDKLGEGEMSELYKAEDNKLKRIVALKVFTSVFSFNGDAKKRFVHEAQSASVSDHPNICTYIKLVKQKTEDRLFPCPAMMVKL